MLQVCHSAVKAVAFRTPMGRTGGNGAVVLRFFLCAVCVKLGPPFVWLRIFLCRDNTCHCDYVQFLFLSFGAIMQVREAPPHDPG